MFILIRRDFYQKVNVDSEKTGGGGAIDMIFTARQLQKKCHEQNVDLYMTFVDLTKAFDTVSRDGLWNNMAKMSCPPRFVAMVRQFHDGMQARVQNGGEFSEPFEVTNGFKQGCVIAPTLFSMMFSAMLMHAIQDGDTGFPIRYRFDGNIFNLRRLQAKTKVQTDVLDELLYADDMDKNASSEAKMQRAIDQVSQSCDNHNLSHNQHKKGTSRQRSGKGAIRKRFPYRRVVVVRDRKIQTDCKQKDRGCTPTSTWKTVQ